MAVSDPFVSEGVERVALTVPGELRYVGVVRLFVGGVAARVGLGFEAMDDLQLALESVVRRAVPCREITLETCIDGDALSVLVGPFERDLLRPDTSDGRALELERLLSALVTGAESISGDDGYRLRLDMRARAGSGSA